MLDIGSLDFVVNRLLMKSYLFKLALERLLDHARSSFVLNYLITNYLPHALRN